MLFRVILFGLVIGLLPAVSQAKLTVFACEPEWASLVEALGKDLVKVKVATHAMQDPHHIRAKPSLIASIRKADLLVCSGASLEVGWLPLLIQRGKTQVQPGQVGSVMAADYVKKLEVRQQVDRSMGDVHPEGNPHVHLDPRNIPVIAKEVASRLARIDGSHKQAYQANLASFLKRWKVAMKRWAGQAQTLRNMKVVIHHNNWAYLANWLKLDIVAMLEPKPGIPPSSSHLETVLAKVKGQNVRAILRSSYEDDRPSEWLSEKSSIPALALPYTVGGAKEVDDLISLFDKTLKQLTETL